MENFTIPNTSKKCVGLVKMLQVFTQPPIQLKELVKAFSIFVVKVIGYQKGSPSEFVGGTRSLDGIYLEGISVTYGEPRKHLYSLAVGISVLSSSI